ncbi:Adenine nucleotide alpha hydrolases-like superfamily protein [Euphorbia peplus]|nr:Adenine nucleotide alpha hydrolases-like superfamily protein [Euphorbia peplus]
MMSISNLNGTAPHTVAKEKDISRGSYIFSLDQLENTNFRCSNVSESVYQEEINYGEEEEEEDGGRRMVIMDTIFEEDIFEGSLFSLDIGGRCQGGGDCVYVAVGKSDMESSMDALLWTLKNLVNGESSTMVYLIHVYPETHYIPSPLGRLPKSQVNPHQIAVYMEQQRGNRRQLLQEFINVCSASKIKVETVFAESDVVAKAILDLIPILNIRKLVLGTSKSTLR